jgi:hypothetical protein
MCPTTLLSSSTRTITPQPSEPKPSISLPKMAAFTKRDPTKPGFPNFPLEVRDLIYNHAFTISTPIELDSTSNPTSPSTNANNKEIPNPSAFLTSRSFALEPSPMYFKQNRFTLTVPEYSSFDEQYEILWRTVVGMPYPVKLPPRSLKYVRCVSVNINYRNVVANRPISAKIHEFQIIYLMETAKLLSQNENLEELNIQFSEYSNNPLRRTHLLHLIWPFLLFVCGVPEVTLSRRQFRPDGVFHPATSFNVLPPDMAEALLFKCRALPKGDCPYCSDKNYVRSLRRLEKNLANEFDGDLQRGWMWESLRQALEVQSQYDSSWERIARRGENIGAWDRVHWKLGDRGERWGEVIWRPVRWIGCEQDTKPSRAVLPWEKKIMRG